MDVAQTCAYVCIVSICVYKSAGTSRLVLSLFVLRPCKINTLLPGTSQKYIHTTYKRYTLAGSYYTAYITALNTKGRRCRGGRVGRGGNCPPPPPDFVRI